VKIRARSLFRTPRSRVEAGEAGSGLGVIVFLTPPQAGWRLHRLYTGGGRLPLAGIARPGAKSKKGIHEERLTSLNLIKTAAEVCPLCQGTGWKTIRSGNAPGDRRVTRCDCQLRARAQTLLTAARIPKRYEHCELASYTTDFPGAHPSLAFAYVSAAKFAQEYDPRDGTGLLIIGKIGTGKTHLAVGITKELILNKGIPCLFYDYRELLKEIQNSYNATVQTTELDVLRPVFETDVLVLDELGAVKPTEWVWDTVSLILNTRYNNNRTTIITTNFEDQPAAGANGSVSPARAATRAETLGDRIGERMRSRLHEMCRVIKMEGEDFRQTYRSASFR